jgi:Tfp pilus assembly protein PilF
VKERYPSAKALAEDLTRWLDGQEVLAERPGKLRRKKQLLSAGIAAGALLVVGFLAIALFSGAPTIERELALAAELVRDRNYPSARAVYDRILVRTPGQKQALTGKLEIKRRIAEERTAAGDRFLREKKYSEAFDAFSFALIEDPTQTRAIEGRDLALRHLGGPDARVQPR